MKLRITGLLIFLCVITAEESYSQSFINGRLNERGINLTASFTNDFLQNVSGGINESSSYVGLFQPALHIDLSKTIGWKDAELYVSAIGNIGDQFNDNVGAEQGIDNIEAGNEWKIYELWLEQNLFNDRLSMKIGLYDLNSEFDTRTSSSVFINPSHGIGAEYALTGENGPSIFPNTSFAVRIKYIQPTGFYFQSAVFFKMKGEQLAGLNYQNFDNNNGILIASEIGYEDETDNASGSFYKISAGGWFYSNKFEELSSDLVYGNPVYRKGNYGLYFSAEKSLFAEEKNTGEGLAAFIRIGISDNSVNRVDGYYGAGINYTGLIPGREEDVFGIALAAAHNGGDFRNAEAAAGNIIKEYEYIWEVTYEINLRYGIKVQPDFQFVKNPADCYRNNYCTIIGTRLQYNLN